jgi:hypothetical protein
MSRKNDFPFGWSWSSQYSELKEGKRGLCHRVPRGRVPWDWREQQGLKVSLRKGRGQRRGPHAAPAPWGPAGVGGGREARSPRGSPPFPEPTPRAPSPDGLGTPDRLPVP